MSTKKTLLHINDDLPHVAQVITDLRAKILGPQFHVTLSGLAPSHVSADRSLAGRIVCSLGATLHANLRLPFIDTLNDKEEIKTSKRLVSLCLFNMSNICHA